MPWLFVGIFGLIAIACGAEAGDQRTKRKQEQQRFRRELGRLAEHIAAKERELDTLRGLLGVKNQQVRTLAAEVNRLRAELDAMLRRASA